MLEDGQDKHKRDRSKSGDMGTTIENMYSKYKDKRGGLSARPNPISSSQAIGLKRDLAEQLPRLKGKGSEPRNKQVEPKVTNPTEAGLVNLRIKSSKAFPLSEVSVIEDLISKFKRQKIERTT